MSNPEEIRRDIERTRSELSSNVDALTEKVSPARVVERRVESARGAITGVKDKVMGSSESNGCGGDPKMSSAASSASAASGAASSVAGAASSVANTASGAPQVARARTQGNPLAAGLMAFGAGWLISSLLPASEPEQQAAVAIKDKASEHSDKLTAPLKAAAQEVGENLREPAQQAAESLKTTATEAAATVKDDAQAAKSDLTDQAKQSTDNVKAANGNDEPGGSEGFDLTSRTSTPTHAI